MRPAFSLFLLWIGVVAIGGLGAIRAFSLRAHRPASRPSETTVAVSSRLEKLQTELAALRLANRQLRDELERARQGEPHFQAAGPAVAADEVRLLERQLSARDEQLRRLKNELAQLQSQRLHWRQRMQGSRSDREAYEALKQRYAQAQERIAELVVALDVQERLSEEWARQFSSEDR